MRVYTIAVVVAVTACLGVAACAEPSASLSMPQLGLSPRFKILRNILGQHAPSCDPGILLRTGVDYSRLDPGILATRGPEMNNVDPGINLTPPKPPTVPKPSSLQPNFKPPAAPQSAVPRG
jgi:hypothetical protein